MLLLHLFKLPHNGTERNQVLTLLWLPDNKVPVFSSLWVNWKYLTFFKFVFGLQLHIDYKLVCVILMSKKLKNHHSVSW